LFPFSFGQRQRPNEKGNKNRQYNGQAKRGRRTDNTKAKRKGEQVQKIQWPNEKGNKYRQYNGQAKRGRSTDNTMAKRKGEEVQTIQWPNEKGTKRQTIIYKALHRKPKMEQHESHKNTGFTEMLWRVVDIKYFC
jgi:hypothetical protein